MSRGGHRYGAGRPGQRIKAENCRSIDVRQFNREGVLTPGAWSWSWRDAETLKLQASITVCAAPGRVVLRYAVGTQDIAENVPILRTACSLGGDRPWFACPRCHGRVAILYLHGLRFACRHCQDLVYRSQSAGRMYNAFARLRKLENRLGPNWTKPKGMHWHTAQRLLERAHPLALAANGLMTLSTNALVQRLESLDLLDDFGRGWQATQRSAT